MCDGNRCDCASDLERQVTNLGYDLDKANNEINQLRYDMQQTEARLLARIRDLSAASYSGD